VLAQAPSAWQVHAVSRQPRQTQPNSLEWHVCDTLEKEVLTRVLRQVRPDAVIHTAAIADIDLAEREQKLAWAVNVGITQVLVNACSELGCRLVFCSTDTIFDGERAPYREEHAPGPVNYYARTKVEAEQLVQKLGSQAVIARLALVAGLPLLGSGNSFVARLLATLKGNGKITVAAAHEIRTPIDVITLGAALLELSGSHFGGIVHLAGNDRLNRLELTKRVVASLGYPVELVSPINSEPNTGRAKRPRDVSLENSKARAQLKMPMRSFGEGLSLMLKHAGYRLDA
jgi:dTDP-4-dehydrorhamnose reductase